MNQIAKNEILSSDKSQWRENSVVAGNDSELRDTPEEATNFRLKSQRLKLRR